MKPPVSPVFGIETAAAAVGAGVAVGAASVVIAAAEGDEAGVVAVALYLMKTVYFEEGDKPENTFESCQPMPSRLYSHPVTAAAVTEFDVAERTGAAGFEFRVVVVEEEEGDAGKEAVALKRT